MKKKWKMMGKMMEKKREELMLMKMRMKVVIITFELLILSF